jgi:hypothetical protein
MPSYVELVKSLKGKSAITPTKAMTPAAKTPAKAAVSQRRTPYPSAKKAAASLSHNTTMKLTPYAKLTPYDIVRNQHSKIMKNDFSHNDKKYESSRVLDDVEYQHKLIQVGDRVRVHFIWKNALSDQLGTVVEMKENGYKPDYVVQLDDGRIENFKIFNLIPLEPRRITMRKREMDNERARQFLYDKRLPPEMTRHIRSFLGGRKRLKR